MKTNQKPKGKLNYDSLYNKHKPQVKVHPKVAQLYHHLCSLGFTKHRENTKAYKHTIECLTKLLSPKAKNPYSDIYFDSEIMQEHKDYKCTYDEALDVFEFYAEKCQGLPLGSISYFICNTANKNVNPYSYFLAHLVERKQNKFNNPLLEKLKKALDFIPKDHPYALKEKHFIVLANRLAKMMQEVSLAPGAQFLHYNDITFLFKHYVKERSRNIFFKYYYACGERFIADFIRDSAQKGALIVHGVQGAHGGQNNYRKMSI